MFEHILFSVPRLLLLYCYRKYVGTAQCGLYEVRKVFLGLAQCGHDGYSSQQLYSNQ